jgi:predicted membrane protein
MQVWLNVMELAERVKIAKQLVKMLCKANVILLAIFTVFHVALMHQKTLSSTYTIWQLVLRVH